jgi:hypothetical protein
MSESILDPNPDPECIPVSVPLTRKVPFTAVPVPAPVALSQLNPDPQYGKNECLATRQLYSN